MTTEYLNNKTFEKIICTFQRCKREKAKYELIIEDLQETKKRKLKREVDASRELDLIEFNQSKYQEIEEEFNTSQNQLASAFYTLSENIVRYAKFNLIDAEDAIQEGVVICFVKIDRFDPRKGKAFNYMTTCILNHFRQLYRTARNYNELKKRYLDFLEVKLSSHIVKNRPNNKKSSNYQNND